MKRLSFRQKLRLERRRRRRFKQRARRQSAVVSVRTLERSGRVWFNNANGAGWVYASGRIPMPRTLCLEQNYEETARVLLQIRNKLTDNLRQAFARNQSPPARPAVVRGYYDFVTMMRCSPSAALILASEYDRARSLINWSIPVVNLHRWPPAIVSTLDEIGFFALLAIDPMISNHTSSAVEIVRFKSGDVVAANDVAELSAILAEMILGDVDENTADDVFQARLKVYGALIEATENTCLHAYKDDTRSLVVHRWWMTGAVDRESRHLNIVVYDQGWSIPETLPHWDKYPLIERGLARLRKGRTADGVDDEDAAKLRLAMTVPRSSTGESNRGKGFPAFRDVLNACRSGKLRIVSRRGEFQLETGQRPRSQTLNTPLTGTLVEWDLWL